MVTNRPYGDIEIVKGYLSNVKLMTTTIAKLLDRAASDVEKDMKMAGTEFQTDYVYYNTIKELAELKAGCLGHLSYGKREDAKIFCDLYTAGVAGLLVDDTVLESETDGAMEPQIPETYPSNLGGTHLLGRNSNTWTDGVPTP
jgi:hypothetical protein